MKLIKKIATIMLSVMMVLGMASVVNADGTESGTSTVNTGKITTNKAIARQTYRIYKILELESYDTTTENYAYKATSAWESFIESTEAAAYFKTDSNGGVTWNAVSGETEEQKATRAAEFAKKALEYAEKNNISNAGFSDRQNVTTVTFDNLSLGYYLVDSSVGALCGLTTTNPTATIQEKNDVPSVDKKVQEDSTNAWGDSNTADIGQTVNFQTTITAQPGAQNYVLHDKMDLGLTFNTNSVQVKLKKNTETTESVVAASNYEVKTNGLESTDPCTFHVEFKKEFCDTLAANDQIIVTYSAILNENAVIAGAGNVNETWLKYGDNSETTHDATTTKTYSIPVFKYTGSNTALADAVFELYRNDKNCTAQNKINLAINGKDGEYDIYRIATATGTTPPVKTSSTGKFKICGLDADTYYLKEIEAPKGYNKLSAPIKVAISEEGNITVNDVALTVTEVKVLNNTGTILPTTGGNGTSLIYFLGAVLALVSGVVLITKQRMKNS